MRTVAVVALKGGVGKSSVVAELGLGLVERKLRVGLVDVDVTGSNLYSALGLENSPRWILDSSHEKIIVPKVGGYYLLSIASHAGESHAVLWEGTHYRDLQAIKETIQTLRGRLGKLGENNLNLGSVLQEVADIETTLDKKVRRGLDDVLASSKWRFVKELFSDIVLWPEELDYLIVDMPPSTSSEMFSFFEQVKESFFGVIIVSQPSAIANTGLIRTISLLRNKQIPIIGLVANLDGFLTSTGAIEYQFLSPRVDLAAVAKETGIPFLVSIPQVSDREKAAPYFNTLVDKILNARPVVLKEVTTMRRIKRQLVKGIIKFTS